MGSIQDWGKKINWDTRIKSVCKPCWEIKYCPYGPLVEKFPLTEKRDEKSCRIFGHHCPVFYVAEPFTETKQLRNISRSIPRNVQFRVLKRDNQICSNCGNSVLDEDVEFDHIIPWSKGGSSDEHNVKLLCRKCNRKKGKKFEELYLINDVGYHIANTVPYEFIKTTFDIINIIHSEYDLVNKNIPPIVFTRILGGKKVTKADENCTKLVNEIRSFFISEKPNELSKNEFGAIKYRWGFIDSKFHKLKDTLLKYYLSIEELYNLDYEFVQRLGYYIKINENVKEKWKKS